MTQTILAAIVGMCLGTSQLSAFVSLPGGPSGPLTVDLAPYVVQEEKEPGTPAAPEEEDVCSLPLAPQTGSAENTEANPSTEVTATEEIDYAALAASFPSTPLSTSSLVGLDDSKSWWFRRNTTKTPPTAQNDICIFDYNAYYLGDTSEKIIYLTFDEGYENGYTAQILDILKANDVKAAFFVTVPYIEQEPELVKRMVEEGHVVGNHSDTHPNMSTLSEADMAQEINNCNAAFEALTGRPIDPFFRPPAGEYSIRSLTQTNLMGYQTIFWSLAYQDWDVNNQPGKDAAYHSAVDYVHNGAIVLLHAVSQSNTEALDDVLKTLKAEGYQFKSLYDLPDAQQMLEALQQQQAQ